MFDVGQYLFALTGLLQRRFGPRLVYVGLQGSYMRNEATQDSDIDVMVVIDGMDVSDLDSYKQTIESLAGAEKSCGFICSREDLAHWNPMEICHLLHSTKDYYGTLSQLVPAWSETDVLHYVKLSVNNLYHELCHRYIHASAEENRARLPGTYRGVFFILQNLYYLKTGQFAQTKAELLPLLSGKDREVLCTAMELKARDEYDFDACFALLFTWCQTLMRSL